MIAKKNKINGFTKKPQTKSGGHPHWISVSDLMAALMMIFLLVSISYMAEAKVEKEKIKKIAEAYKENKLKIHKDLEDAFIDDFDKWGAELTKDLSIRFNEPSTLFNMGSFELKDEFKIILDDFIPRYMAIITSPKYKDSISQVRIEGHTSSTWSQNISEGQAYFLNMELSQNRTLATLQYIMTNPNIQDNILWLRQKISGSGMSSSHLILNELGLENSVASQRVEFKITNNSEEKLGQILDLK